MEQQLSDLIRERQQFENQAYDLLVNVDLLVPENFWEPVPVKAEIEFEKVKTTDNCFICFNKKDTFNLLKCCKKKMCESCSETWFEKSVKCPFCVQDIRNF